MPQCPGEHAPHTAGAVHDPHSSILPQPSLAGPQLMPRSAHVFGAHDPLPHTAKPPPPQTEPDGHAPQESTLPHPSFAGPQL